MAESVVVNRRSSWGARIPLDLHPGLHARVPVDAQVPLSARDLDARLDCLAGMLPPWLEKLRHPAQFWPQFDALAQQILDRADTCDQARVRQRIGAMLADHAHALPPGGLRRH